MKTLAAADERIVSRWQWRSLAIGVVALAVLVVAAPASRAQFFRAYLAAYLFWLGLTLGSMALVMIYHLTGGAWGFLIRRVLEAGMRTLPLMALLLVPIAYGVGDLYLWAQPSAVAGDGALQHTRAYLNPTFFWIRSAAYFGTWWLLTYLLGSVARRQDRTGDQRLTPWLRTLSGFGLLAYGVGMNFASVDWVMSLQTPFHSTILGPLMAAGHLLSALALTAIVLCWLAARRPVAQVISPDVVNDLASLLFALLVVWAYMVWFQFMLIWIADLPTDVIWYLARATGGWQWVAWALCGFGFVVPLTALLLRRVKRDLTAVARVAGLILFAQLVYAYYLVMPAFGHTSIGEHWMDFVMPIGLGGVWLSCFLWQLGRDGVLPQADFNQNEAVRLRDEHQRQLVAEEALAHG
jgi:hypothetical protein